jgi:hypothetical protein
MSVAEAEAAESRLDVGRLVRDGVEGAVLELFRFPAGEPPRAVLGTASGAPSI